ncbi:MAG: phosphopantothenate/pantothenate synthetase [Spirochaetales bacterium]|nr:phosphopantothenate/pantothenate synthetase [Spirochaetales bacterium]
MEIPTSHPRYQSLLFREKIIEGLYSKVVTEAGLFAHGRGESLDYFLGEKSEDFSFAAARAAAASLLLAERPVISVNGNAAALVSEELVALAQAVNAKLEVNLFYRAHGREEAIERVLRAAGALEVLGVGAAASATIPEIQHERRRVDPRGILVADVVLVPLEDGDRTEALVNMGKTVLTIDLNPLSRTAQKSHVTVVDNIVRALPHMIQAANELRNQAPEVIKAAAQWNNAHGLARALRFYSERLNFLAQSLEG